MRTQVLVAVSSRVSRRGVFYPPTSFMITLPGYQILAKLYESTHSLVLRGRQEQPSKPVILKLLKQDYPTEEELARYRQEYELTKRLEVEGVVEAYSLQKYQNALVMILEDFGGESLSILMSSQKLTLLGFLNLAVKIAESLGQLHASNIIHKDINPSNIVFNPVSGQVKLIDLGISTVLNREGGTSKNSADLEGTLAYMSPEQTGRMNRSLDYRTDFYSLGATFYQLLTNQLPFAATDAMELVHCHIAKQPLLPHTINPEIPKAVSDIVMKLLAKTAEDRYQSAWGLIADLQECLTRLETTGSIAAFPVGRQDISDKFQIPQKLYGREGEIKTLLKAYDRVRQGTMEIMLVAGYSGVGKSALVQAIYKPIICQNGYFIWGKFDQFQRTIPYSAIVSAFSELVRLLLTESEEKLGLWREKLLAAFGPNGQIIIDVIPEVELIVGTQPTVAELGPTESQNRFNLVFQNFIRVFCQPEHPLVIFLDDLQWADSATLKLIQVMMTGEEEHYLFLIGAYRDNEVNGTHPLMITLDTLRHDRITINQIILDPLNVDQSDQLIAETLHSDSESVRPLAELVVRKTGGNPFFVSEFMKTLYQENLLTFQPPHAGGIGRWKWDVAEIEAMSITDNVVDLMIGKLQKFPESTQQVLRLGACLGNQFDLNTLSLIHEKESSETFQDLLPAIQEELIKPSSEIEAAEIELINYPLLILNYKFLHDRVQQAAYSLIDDGKKQAVHLRIGRMLLASTPEEYQLDRVFELVDHLNVGRALIAEALERLKLAGLNLEAGKKAKDATAFVAARQYLIAGMDLLTEKSWDEDYELAFALHRERADIEYLNGNFEESEYFINQTLERARSTLEKAEVYNLLLIQYNLRAKYEEAVKAGRKVLSLLGMELPQTEELQGAIATGISEAKEVLGERDIRSLIDAPKIQSADKKVALKILNNLAPSVYMLSPQLWTAIVLKGVKISIESGYVRESSFFYPTYGILLAAMFQQYKSAYDFGVLAFEQSQAWGDPIYKAGACLVGALNYWYNHAKESTSLANDSYQSALESGDLQYAGYVLNNKAMNSFFQGTSCSQLLQEIPKYLQFSQKTENQMVTDTLKGLKSILLNLTKATPERQCFDSDELRESAYLEDCQTHKNFLSLCIYYIFKIQCLYWYGDLEEALKVTLETEGLVNFILGMLPVTFYNFYASLVLAAACPEASAGDRQQYEEKIEANQQQMKVWAENCPQNFLHKYLMVEAQRRLLAGDELEFIELCDRAITAAREAEFVQEEALANELAAKFWLSKGKEKYAKLHLSEAYYGYQRWGAARKVAELEIEYPQLLTQTLTDTASAISVTTTTHASTGRSKNAGALDLATAIKVSQAISGEIVLDKLLASLMKSLIENAGARKGFLILPEDGKMQISAEASVDAEEGQMLESTPVLVKKRVIDSQDLPVTVINYVERSRLDVVLSDASTEGQFTHDPYIASKKLKSLLCTPILNQGKPIGILYLENKLTAGAFTGDRLELLRLLSSQAAISLENALLYASLEQKVQERTQELNEKNIHLSQTLKELQRTQTQLIQTEKMSGLGQMVAGVAHEINNPVSFIYGNLEPAGDYVQDLLNLIDTYQQHTPDPAPEIIEEIENIDLEFLKEDLPKLLDSMQEGAERIRKIVLSLRTFSRLDESGMKSVDIHEGIDSTLLILQSRLKDSSKLAAIEVIKEYGQLPRVACYASQLNQVLMNLLTNACDALSEIRENPEAFEKKPTITIRTAVTASNLVKIQIADNGCGMSEDVRKKIFDPFFTTKPVGSGTGLGLSVSYQIIVDTHGGKLSCESAPGRGAQFAIEIPIKPHCPS